MGKGATYELCCEFRHETENAILIYDAATDTECWLPLSAVHEIHGSKTKGSTITILMEEWIARKRGFI